MIPEKLPTKPIRNQIQEQISEKGDLLQPGDSLQTTSDRMVSLDATMLPVTEAGRLIGMADEANPGLVASAHGHDPKTTRISETMSRDLVYCHEEDDCAGALRKMEERDLSHLPVLDHEMKMLALVARADLIAGIERAVSVHGEVGSVGSLHEINMLDRSPSAKRD